MRNANYEKDNAAFPADAYSVRQYPGVAFRVCGWETEETEDTHWDGIEERTGRVIAIMIGDDHHFSLDASDVTPLPREDYCNECGQIGCTHDALDREAG